jgi:putative DNA primase/helicase
MQTASGALRGAYEAWCQQEGEEPVSAKKFAATLQRAPYNVHSGRTSRMRYFDGIRLTSPSSPGYDGEDYGR